MEVESITVESKDDILVAAPCDAVYQFIAAADTRADPISPLDAHLKPVEGLQPNSRGMCELNIAGRVLEYETLSKEAAPPDHFKVEMQGDVMGEQAYDLFEEAGGTRLSMALSYVVPPDWPAYYRDEPTKSRFAQTLVSQTLANIKAAVENG